MKRCIACGAKLLEPLFSIENMPESAQNIPDSEGLSMDHGIQVSLCECSGCGLMQLDTPPVSYYRDVIRAGGFSTTMEHLRRDQYKRWIKNNELTGKKIIEAGCGRGEFLRILKTFPVRAFGLEHKKELVDIAVRDGLDVYEGFAENEDTVFPGKPYDGFTSFNFLEHQPDPVGYLRAIYANLTDSGCGLITVPSFEYILEQNSFYEIIPDHIAYYTEEVLTCLLNRCGFDVIVTERVNRDTIAAEVKKKTAPDTMGIIKARQRIKEEVKNLLEETEKAQKKLAVWGAGHQGFTLCATTKLMGSDVSIIDSADFKQGRYAPASHIPIISPKQALANPPGIILIVAPGYTDEIAGIIKRDFPKGTKIYSLKTDHIESVN